MSPGWYMYCKLAMLIKLCAKSLSSKSGCHSFHVLLGATLPVLRPTVLNGGSICIPCLGEIDLILLPWALKLRCVPLIATVGSDDEGRA